LVGDERDLDFVRWHRQAIVRDVKHSFGGSFVHERVVQDATLVQAVAADLGVEKFGLAHREAEFLRKIECAIETVEC